jgi:hypothetical protein
MKSFLIVLLFALPAFSQDSNWIRTESVNKLTGHSQTTYSVSAKMDSGNARKPFIAIVCSKEDKRYTYRFFADDTVHVEADVSNPATNFYQTQILYRADSTSPKTIGVVVWPDFASIDLNQGMLAALSGSQEFAISYPSERGYQVTDLFYPSGLPAQYIDDCYSDKMKRKMQKGR